MEKVKTRVEYVDITKAVAIFCVLMGHTVDSDTSMKVFLYAFHMPAFFVLSGMVIKIQSVENVKAFIGIMKKNTIALMLPYAVWACIYSAFSFKNMALIAYGTREALNSAGSLTSLWFLPVRFLSVSVILPVMSSWGGYCHWKIKTWLMGSICFFIGILLPHWSKYGDPWGIDIAFVAAAFVMAGKLLRPLFDRLENSGFGCFVTAAIGLILLLIGVHFNITSVGYVLMANAIYGNILQFVVGAMGGSILLLSVSVLVSKFQFMGKKWIRYIGKNTLGIFLVHKPIVELGRKVVMKVGLDYNHFALCILISLVSLLISLVVVYMIDHLLPEVLGRRKA